MGERAPYSRVYWSVVDDEKFAAIYDDDRHLATWLRLLISADAIWPASPTLPVGVKRGSVKALSEAGLVDLLSGHRYRIHGLDAERGRRKEKATTRTPDGSPTVTGRLPDGPSRAGDALLVSSRLVSSNPTSENSTAEPARDPGLDGGEAAVFAFLAQHGAAIREDSGYGRRLLGLMERRTPERVLETAWDIAQGDAKLSDRQWTFGLEARLEPPEDGRAAAKAERAAESERQSRRGFEDTQRYIRELRGETEPKAGVA